MEFIAILIFEVNDQGVHVMGQCKLAWGGVIYWFSSNDLNFPVLEHIHKYMAVSRSTPTLFFFRHDF